MSCLKPDDPRLLFVPLGGCGEIGMNLSLYGHRGRWLMIDCGMAFAGDEAPGVDLVFPDTRFIEGERDKLEALVVTHGHEDHIGAIPYLWPYLECPIYATRFTAGLIRAKLEEEGIADQVPLHIIRPGDVIKLGPFSVRYIALAHSIAEGHGLSISTAAGTVFHTGDWKIDETPLIGPVSPANALTALGDAGVLALVGDSTNIFNPSESGSEAAVRDSLLKLIKPMRNRVVLTTFASNVARLETAGYIARKTGRELALIGRSMQRIYQVARDAGYLQDFPPPLAEQDLAFLPRDKVMILCTGCQGEPRAALARMARGDHRDITLSEGDHVIFSSKIIPGNEKTLGALFNSLVERGLDVTTEKDAFIHVSGHPGQAELRQMIDWIRPDMVIPVHGEARHLARHAAFAREEGVKASLVPRNGDIIDLAVSGPRKIDEVTAGRLALDGQDIVNITAASITERRRMLFNGVVALSLILNSKFRLAGPPTVTCLGLPRGNDSAFLALLQGEAEAALERIPERRRRDLSEVQEGVRVALRRACRQELGKNPQTMIHIFSPEGRG